MDRGGGPKQAFMIKRSRQKNPLSPMNYKSRWFKLSSEILSYHDGSLEKGAGKEKGRIPIQSVRGIEGVEDYALDEKINAFQVVYQDNGREGDIYPLYIVAQSRQQKEEWIEALRKVCDTQRVTCNFLSKYHPGVWNSRFSRYTCCDQISRASPGCKPSHGQFDYRPDVTTNGTSTLDRIPPVPSSTSTPPVYHRKPDIPLPPTPVVSKTNSLGPARAPIPIPTERPPATRSSSDSATSRKVIALYDYNAVERDDLSLTKGEQYEVQDSSREHWWKVRDRKGKDGFVPANYVREVTLEGLESYDWYYKDKTRAECEGILKSEGKEGCFLVRDSSTPGCYTLSIFTKEVPEGLVRHYRIKRNSRGEYSLTDKRGFKDLPALVFYHKHNSAGLAVRLRSPPSDNSPGFQFRTEKWEIDPAELTLHEELGRGQFGSVRRGRLKGQMDVAVKMMHPNAMQEDDFLDEAKIMMKLHHANLVQLYGVCTKARPIYIVTEYLKNGSLKKYLSRHRDRFIRETGMLLYMCIQVAKALEYLEAHNFIHRDLAARNCLVGHNSVVKVGDFGLARFVLDDEYTSSCGAKFPIKWASPEVLGYTRFSSKSDMWAFGVLMWEIFSCGEMPYGRVKHAEVIRLVVEHNMRLERPSNCPDSIYREMYTCWTSRPEDRPTFLRIRERLEELQEDADYC